MIDMICDNCGVNIDEGEEYCPNCGMELLIPKTVKNKYYEDLKSIYSDSSNFSKPAKRYNNDSRSFNFDNSQTVEKPIKQRYMKYSKPESPDYSKYYDEEEYEESEYHQQDYYEEDYKEKSGSGIGNIVLLLFIALILGFIAGLLMFGSQSIPQIPGFNV